MDIVERLRREASGSGTYTEMARKGIMLEAANEIDRLRNLLKDAVHRIALLNESPNLRLEELSNP